MPETNAAEWVDRDGFAYSGGSDGNVAPIVTGRLIRWCDHRRRISDNTALGP